MSKSDSVHVGQDGWMFLTGGSNHVIDFYTIEGGGIDPNAISGWADLTIHRSENFSQKGTQYVHLFVPEKLTIYPEFFNGELPHFNSHPLSQLAAHFSKRAESNRVRKTVINPIEYFREQKKHFDLYWKTDTHWRFEGCYSAYQLICKNLGLSPLKDLHHRPYSEGMISFDLGGKFDPPVREKGRFYDFIFKAKRVVRNNIVKYKEQHGLENEGTLHVGSNVVFENHHADAIDAKVILFGDSFSEYRPNLLTGMLAETFRELHFIWSTSLDNSYINNTRPDIVISESAERFMTKLPADDFNLEEYSTKKLKALRRKQI